VCFGKLPSKGTDSSAKRGVTYPVSSLVAYHLPVTNEYGRCYWCLRILLRRGPSHHPCFVSSPWCNTRNSVPWLFIFWVTVGSGCWWWATIHFCMHWYKLLMSLSHIDHISSITINTIVIPTNHNQCIGWWGVSASRSAMTILATLALLLD